MRNARRYEIVQVILAAAFTMAGCGTNMELGSRDITTPSDDGGTSAATTSAGNGSQSDNGPCTAGQTRDCGPKVLNVGICRQGHQTCDHNGGWSACTGIVTPQTEIPGDGLDNDCDGLTDEPADDAGANANTHGQILEADGGGTRGTTQEGQPDASTVTTTTGQDDASTVTTTTGQDDAGTVTTTTGQDDAGTVTVTAEAGCDVDPPRLIAPLSTARVTSRQPNLKWALAAGSDGARIELCADRACSTVLGTIDASGTTTAPTSDLPVGVAYWRARGMHGTDVGCTTSPTWEFFVGPRTAPQNTSWGTMLDVNEDGYADVLVSESGTNNLSAGINGQVHVYLGSASGLPASPSLTINAPAIPDSYGFFGIAGGIDSPGLAAAASAGDVNGDGFADVVASTPLDGSGGYSGGTETGRVYVYFGNINGVSTTPDITIVGPDPGFFGRGVASAGDVNGDGYADVVVGGLHQSYAQGASAAYLYLGGPSGLATSPAVTFGEPTPGTDTQFGSAVSGAGDIDADGYDDIVIGSAFGAGGAHFYRGGPSGISSTPSQSLLSPTGGYGFGRAVAGAGDTNGDGYADVLILGDATATAFTPRVFVYEGSASGIQVTPSAVLADATRDGDKTEFGNTMVGFDSNGDGYWDVAVGAPIIGQVYVFLGSSAGVSETPVVTLTGGDTNFFKGGFGVGLGAGDVNGDRFFEDLMVGANSGGANGYGRAYYFSGSTVSVPTTPTISLDAPSTNGGFGSGVPSQGGGA